MRMEHGLDLRDEGFFRDQREGMPAFRKPYLSVSAALLLPALVEVHILVRGPEKVLHQIIMILIAHLPADGIAQRQFTALVILLHQLPEMSLHRRQHFRRRMLLDDHEFIAAEAGEEAVTVENTRKIGSKCLYERVATLVTVVVIDPLEPVQIEHHDADVQGITPLLQLEEMLFQRFFIPHARHIREGLR